jgi:hypothetical protein
MQAASEIDTLMQSSGDNDAVVATKSKLRKWSPEEVSRCGVNRFDDEDVNHVGVDAG